MRRQTDMQVKGRSKGTQARSNLPVHRHPFRDGLSSSGFRKISTLIRIKRSVLVENTDACAPFILLFFPYIGAPTISQAVVIVLF